MEMAGNDHIAFQGKLAVGKAPDDGRIVEVMAPAMVLSAAFLRHALGNRAGQCNRHQGNQNSADMVMQQATEQPVTVVTMIDLIAVAQ